MAIRCAHCNYDNAQGSLICAQCYSLLVPVGDKQPDTTLTAINPNTISASLAAEAGVDTRMFTSSEQRMLTQRFSTYSGHLSPNMVALFFNQTPEPLILQIIQQAILGRAGGDNISQPRVDLTPFGAYTKGVSRMHAIIRRIGTRLMIEDLESSNGTYVNSEQLRPYTPRPLQSGDRIRLGQLEMALYSPGERKEGS